MEVKLINKPQEILNILYTAARTCYNAGSPIDMWQDILLTSTEDKIKLITNCIKAGHESVLEHVTFTFAIEGISRACSHQLVRHRLCAFSQQSQRYVEIKEDWRELLNVSGSPKQIPIVNKYFVVDSPIKELSESLHTQCISFLLNYLYLINQGMKPEDARMILPNCTKTNLVMSCNLRELLHICNERLCSKAQAEIRQLVQRMVNEVVDSGCEWLKPYMQPKCERLGHCPESKSCGRKQ